MTISLTCTVYMCADCNSNTSQCLNCTSLHHSRDVHTFFCCSFEFDFLSAQCSGFIWFNLATCQVHMPIEICDLHMTDSKGFATKSIDPGPWLMSTLIWYFCGGQSIYVPTKRNQVDSPSKVYGALCGHSSLSDT